MIESNPQGIWIPPLDNFLLNMIGPQWCHWIDIIDSHTTNTGAH